MQLFAVHELVKFEPWKENAGSCLPAVTTYLQNLWKYNKAQFIEPSFALISLSMRYVTSNPLKNRKECAVRIRHLEASREDS
jgi:hypothetical protein